jgi:hypothetical protein
MMDIDEFKRRLADGEYDDAILRLMDEMSAIDEENESTEVLSPEIQRVLDRGRLLARSTLRRLTVTSIASSSIGSKGQHKLLLDSSSGELPATDIALSVDEDGRANLSGTFAVGGQFLDIVAVVPHLKRNSLLKRLAIDLTIIPPSTEQRQSNFKIPGMTVLSVPPLSAGASETDAPPVFQIDFDSNEIAVRVSTLAHPADGDELLVLMTIENEQPVPLILDRSHESPFQLVGQFELPHNLHGAGKVKVKVSSIDVDKLDHLPAEQVSLWLGTQPMIAMPLSVVDNGYDFTICSADREFLEQHVNAILAIRVASLDAEVAV